MDDVSSVKNIYFVVHDATSYSSHPNLIGFNASRTQNNKPESKLVNQISSGDLIIYYMRKDKHICGIFKVMAQLEPSDKLFAKEWIRRAFQFQIEPVLLPKKPIDFRELVYGKNPLDMFKHIRNLKTGWSMSIAGRNYIKRISEHDYNIIRAFLFRQQ